MSDIKREELVRTLAQNMIRWEHQGKSLGPGWEIAYDLGVTDALDDELYHREDGPE